MLGSDKRATQGNWTLHRQHLMWWIRMKETSLTNLWRLNWISLRWNNEFHRGRHRNSWVLTLSVSFHREDTQKDWNLTPAPWDVSTKGCHKNAPFLATLHSGAFLSKISIFYIVVGMYPRQSKFPRRWPFLWNSILKLVHRGVGTKTPFYPTVSCPYVYVLLCKLQMESGRGGLVHWHPWHLTQERCQNGQCNNAKPFAIPFHSLT